MGAPGSSQTGMGPTDEIPRTLHGTDVVLRESNGYLRLELPYKGLSLQIVGMVWIGLIVAFFKHLMTLGVPSWTLVLIGAPGLFVGIVGILRAGTSARFELGPDRFIARGLGLFARTDKSWNRRDILRFKIRDTSAVAQESPTKLYQARLLLELHSGKEDVLIRQGDGLALGHIAVFLSKALQGPTQADDAGGGT